MSKPSIQNITTTQTFQNWFDKTNEMVDIFRDQVVTASVSGDITTGNATLLGSFTANTVTAHNLFEANTVSSVTPGNTIQFDSPIKLIGAADPVVATYSYLAGGGRTRYTNEIISWDVGMEDNANARFIINTSGSGTPRLSLSTTGELTTQYVTVTNDVVVGGDLTVDGTISGSISANNVSVSGTFTGNLVGNLTGDVYASNGTKKILENGNGTTTPATFTGNVEGTVSSLTNHYTDALAEKPTSPTNLWFTTARARGAFSAGTGVTITSGQIAIGQSVATTATPTFAGLNINGAIVATGNITAYGTISDATMKENITPIDNALEKVSKLGGYVFNYKNDDTPMTGVMAQELLDVLPEAVYKIKHPDTNEEVYAVRHGNIIGLLIEAIKELKAQVGK